MISANGGLPAHTYTPQVTPRWPRGSEPPSARRKRAPLHLPDVLKGLHGRRTRLELSIIPRHQQDGVLLWQDEMDRRGHCTGCGRVRCFKRDCRQVRALPQHPVVSLPSSAWQWLQPLYYPVQRVLVDQM